MVNSELIVTPTDITSAIRAPPESLINPVKVGGLRQRAVKIQVASGLRGGGIFSARLRSICMGGPMKRVRCKPCLIFVVLAFAMNAQAQTWIKEDDRPAPLDYGFGPGPPEKNRQPMQEMMMGAPGAAPVGSADAQSKGLFGAPVTWPLIGLHAVLLPDGRVMSYGTDEQGQQGGQFVYDV